MTNKAALQYTSINDLLLKAKVDYRKMKPSNIYKRLPIMYDYAEKARMQGNEETQYIMLQRWSNSIEWLRRTPEYRDEKYSSQHMRANQINEVKKILADLNRRLDARYKQLKDKLLEKSGSAERMDVDNDAGTDAYMSSVDGPIKLPETPTRDPLVGDNEEIINCDQLFQLIQNADGRYLVIDIRPKSQFEASRMLSEKCINIPNSEIVSGVLPAHFERYLRKDKKSLSLIRQRGAQYVDVTVLLDWNTSSKTLTSASHLNVLRKIFEDWDPGIKHKKLTILDGGYAEWIVRYPQFTTNPNVAEPASNNVPDEILDTIEYPEWVHSDDEDSIIKSRESKANSLRSVNKSDATSNVSGDKIYKRGDAESGNDVSSLPSNNFVNSSVDEAKLPIHNAASRQYDDNVPKPQQKRTSSIMKKNDTPVKPTIDRSNKPVSLDTSTPEAKLVLKFTGQLNELAKSKEGLEMEILEQEHALYKQADGKHKGSSEEEYIHGNVVSLCSKLEEKQTEYNNVEDELNKYSAIPEIKFNRADETEKRNLDFNLAMVKRRIKYIAEDRKKLQEKSMKDDYKELPTKENESNIRKEPLKTENSSMGGNLERSYSSPNLLQLIDRKAPKVDRTSKPQAPTYNQNGTLASDNKLSHLSWANREERMIPVHGSVHPGITGLKNLGNSCYMNSIIQCLSNTTHLAKFFTDNLYVDALNTSNDNSTQGQVVEEVAQVIKALWRGQYKSISPHDLKIAVGQYKLQFESYEQQDSHEFLTFLLDWMHNDLKKTCKPPLDMTVAEKAWDKAMDSQKSIISDLFFGQLRSTITCNSCKQSSTTYETFNSLTTSLPHSNRCTLNDCIQKFVSSQKVIGWKCPKCQTPRDATKKFDFVKLAPIIVIHLNRFAETSGWLEKSNTAVDFPLAGFNLKPYLVMDSGATISNIRSYSYSLYAMSNHYGTMDGGHYTAFCKNAAQNKWYKYDDQTVTEVSANQVRSQNTSAYLLFYTSFANNVI